MHAFVFNFSHDTTNDGHELLRPSTRARICAHLSQPTRAAPLPDMWLLLPHVLSSAGEWPTVYVIGPQKGATTSVAMALQDGRGGNLAHSNRASTRAAHSACTTHTVLLPLVHC